MLRIETRLAFINGVLLANRVLIFRFQLLAVSVSNSVLNFQYRGRYNTGISKMSIPVLAGNEVCARNIPLPLKKSGKFDVKTAVKCTQYNLELCTFIFNELLTQKC
jgi:hypothetical protein